MANGGLSVGYGSGATGTATMDSLSGWKNLDIAYANINSTGTVTVAGDAELAQLRMGVKNDTKGTLTVGGTLTVEEINTSYFNIGSGDRSHAEVSATTINKIPTNGLSIAKTGAADAYASVVATNGTLTASKLEVANASGAYGLLSIPDGTLTVHGGAITIADGANATGIVEIAIATEGESAVNVGVASNAVGSLTLTGSETLYASVLHLGETNSGSYGLGSVTLAGGKLVLSGADDIADGSYIDVTSADSKLTLVGRTQTDYEAMWATGALRSNGESGLTGKAFNECFYVVGDILAETPISFISIDNGLGGVDISWDSTPGQTYHVQTNLNLVFPSWGTYTSVVGDGNNMTVTVPASAGAVFYQVTAPITP
jgi:hypothetical protein